MRVPEHPRGILLLAHCLLGDSLVMLPALHALRAEFPEARIGLVSERHGRKTRIRAADVLAGRGLVDEFHEMLVDANPLAKLANRLRLLLRLRLQRWDLGIVLVPPHPPASSSLFEVFGRYLTRFGARRVLLPGPVPTVRRDREGCALPAPHVADTLLAVLAPLLPPAEMGNAQFKLPPLAADRAGGDWPPGTVPVAVAPATNMPCKQWPPERYAEVLRGLAQVAPIHPVMFGAAGDRALCEQVLASLPTGGTLVVGETIAHAASRLRGCAMYLGNDTGVMHLAAAVGKPCVAVFSARDVPGAWYPYGTGHRVFRTPLPCDACFGHSCPLHTDECILSIQAGDVLRACKETLAALGGPCQPCAESPE